MNYKPQLFLAGHYTQWTDSYSDFAPLGEMVSSTRLIHDPLAVIAERGVPDDFPDAAGNGELGKCLVALVRFSHHLFIYLFEDIASFIILPVSFVFLLLL